MKRILVLLAIILVGVLLFRKDHSRLKATAKAVAAPSVLSHDVVSTQAPTKSLNVKISQAVQSKVVEKIEPSISSIPKDETPQVVLDWSTDLGRGMLDSFHDSAKADKMFSFLRTCAEDQSLGMTYRAVCAGNAKRLADRFPDKFSQNYGGFERGLPDKIQKFLAQAFTNF